MSRDYNKSSIVIMLVLFLLLAFFMTLLGIGNSIILETHKYTCEDSNCNAYSGGINYKGQFVDDACFTSENYDFVEYNDDEFVYHSRYGEEEIQFHRFDFAIVEEISNILSIQIKWIGYGGGEKNVFPIQTFWGCGLWVKEDGTYVKKLNSNLNYKSDLTITYKVDDIESILQNGHIYFAAASNYVGGPIQTSELWSDYVEVKIVYQRTQTQLQIQSPSSVFENTYFDVEIIPNIQGIIVNFSGLTYYTNSEGIASVFSPEVATDTSYPITAYMQGYFSDETSITVKNNGSDGELDELVITAPSSAYELDGFQVKVMSGNFPVENVIVNFNEINYPTDEDGFVKITAPEVEVDKEYLITASKDNYNSDEKYISILDSSNPAQGQLIIDSPQYVLELDNFLITIASNSIPVSDVIVNFSGLSVLTDSNGEATLTAPSVTDDTKYFISAEKNGYLSDENEVTVLDETSTLIELTYPNGGEILSGYVNISWLVTNPPSESYNLSIYYKNSEESWIKIVEEYNDINGPYLWDTTLVEDGYPYWIRLVLSASSKTCEDISDFPFSINNDVSTSNSGWVYGYVVEEIDNSVYFVENALICVKISDNGFSSNRCAYTDENGEYTFYVPVGTYNIQASKTGYKTQESIVVIEEDEQIEKSFSLVKNVEEESFIDDTSVLFDYMISEQSQIDRAGAKINLDTEEISYYSDVIEISIEGVETNSFSFNVKAPGGTSEKIIYIQVRTGSTMNIDDLKNIDIEYDGKIIQRKNLDYLINNKATESEAVWAGISTLNTDGTKSYYIAVLAPSFSQHSIKITSTVVSQVIDILSNIFIYIAAIAIFGFIYISPFFLIRKSK